MKKLFLSLFTVFKHLFYHPLTLEYPEKKRTVYKSFRGKPEVEGCIGCGICKKVCPSGAINYLKNDEGKIISYTFDLKKCIFCGNCMYNCPQKAIKMTDNYELGSENKQDLILTYKGGLNDK